MIQRTITSLVAAPLRTKTAAVLGAVALASTLGVSAVAQASSDSASAAALAAAAQQAAGQNQAAGTAAGWWQPRGSFHWQIQFTGQLQVNEEYQVYELDGERTPQFILDEAYANGAKTICYLNAGGYEPWRGDASSFPNSVIGKPMREWKDERWLDVRQRDILLPIMKKRMEQCVEKGFSGVDVDNIDLHQQDSGFPITWNQQLRFTKDLVETAHSLGLGFGMKNSVEQLPDLEGMVDYAINESCEMWNECHTYRGMERLGKPVFHISYQPPEVACPGKPSNFNTIMKKRGLDAWQAVCPKK